MPELLRSVWAQGEPSGPVVAAGALRWTSVDLLERVTAAGSALEEGNAGPVVGVCLPEGPSLVVATLAAMHAGAVAPVRADLPEPSLRAHFERTGASALVGSPGGSARAVARSLGIGYFEMGADGALTRPDAPVTVETTAGRAPVPPGTALLLTTSGTTGEPKVVPLTHANLESSIQRVGETLGLGPDDRSLLVMPLTHIHGLVAGLLAPLAAGGSVALGGPFEPTASLDLAAAWAPTYVTAVPTIHRSLASTDRSDWAVSLRFLRSSSAPLPQSVADDLEQRCSVPVVEAYGMTEAAHQITSNRPADSRRGTVGVADPERVRVIDDLGNDVEPGGAGAVAIMGDNLMPGYVGPEAVNAAAFRDGWFLTGDVGVLDDDRHLQLVGRTKELINRGGETIAPNPIEESIRALRGVRDVSVFAVPHPTLGEQVGAAIVASTDELTAARIQSQLHDRLSEAEIPRVIHLVDEIPVGPTGKVQRNRLAERFAASDGAGDDAPALTPLQQEVVAAWATLGIEATRADDDFVALGGDSLSVIALASGLTARWDRELHPADLLRDSSVEGMAALHDRAADVERVVEPGQSAAQRRMLAAHHLAPGSRAAHLAFRWRAGPGLDVEQLGLAWARVVERHPVLRTVYRGATGDHEVVLPAAEGFGFVVRRAAAEEEAALGHLDEMAAAPYDLADGPLVRIGLARLVDGGWVLQLAYHHIVLDGPSRRIVLDDLARAYDGMLPTGIVDPPRPGRQRLTDEDRDWWRTHLVDASPALPWACASPHEPQCAGRVRPAVRRFDIGPKFVDDLRRVATEHRATPTMVLVAATAVLLHRASGEEHIVVGLPADRRRGISPGAVGLTMDTIAVPVRISSVMTTAQVLAATRESCLEAYRRSDAGLQSIRHAISRVPGEPLIHAAVQVVTEPDALTLPALDVAPLAVDPIALRDDVAVKLDLTGSGAQLSIAFSGRVGPEAVTEVFATEGMRLLRDLVGEHAATAPPGAWSSAAVERVASWEAGPIESPHHRSVDAWFRATVAARRDEVALRTADRRVSFGELDALVQHRADEFAAAVPAAGRIALVLPRDIEIVVAQLAVWRTGCVSICLDPEHPPAVLQQLLDAAEPDAVVDGDDAALRVHPDAAPPGAERVGRAGWGCTTSGSTGLPQLVFGTDSGLVHLAHGWHRMVPDAAIGMATASKPVGAIGFVSEWLVPLLAGSAVVLLDPVTVRDPFRVVRRLRDLEVTWYRGTPLMLGAVARRILARDQPIRNVRFVVSGGDTLTRSDADAIAAAFPNATLVNQYGCTEATAESTMGVVEGGGLDPHVGRPLANVEIRVLDPEGRRVPAGVVGEIHIGGPMVAAGAVCATGDLGWWDAGGRLHFRGRSDSRLSVNGNRIEAGEVEAALRATGLVGHCIVAVDPMSDRGLVAVVVPVGETTDLEIRRAVATRLARYAVPSRVVLVEELPATVRGKVDLRFVPGLAGDTDAAVAPEPSAVADLRAATARVLGRPADQIDPRASLTDNGGDSFSAIELAERVQAIAGLSIDLADLMGDTPLRELSALARPPADDASLPGRLVPIAAGTRGGTLVWFPGGGGFVVEVHRLAHYLDDPPRILAHTYPGIGIGERPLVRMRSLVRRAVDCLVALDAGPIVLGGNSFGGVVAAEVARAFEARRPGAVDGLIILDSFAPAHRRTTGTDWSRLRRDVRDHLGDMRRGDELYDFRWQRTYRASRLMLESLPRRGGVVGVPAVVISTAQRRRMAGPDLGWTSRLPDLVATLELSCDHGHLLVEPHVALTAPAVEEALGLLLEGREAAAEPAS